MIVPDELVGRICKTKVQVQITNLKKLDEIRNQWQGSDVDIVYENGVPILVVIFESREDCLAFKLKYGEEYA